VHADAIVADREVVLAVRGLAVAACDRVGPDCHQDSTAAATSNRIVKFIPAV
jgi:hypothetical protein